MEPITHALSGVVSSSLGIRQEFGSSGVIAFTAACISPDIDSFISLMGQDLYLIHHRGLTHSVVFAPILALLLALFFSLFMKQMAFKNLFLLSLAGLGLHIALDLLNSYGTQIFYPFTHKAYSFDMDIILDAWFFLPLLIGVLLISIFTNNQRQIAASVLVILTVGCGVRFGQKAKAESLIKPLHPQTKFDIIPGSWKVIYSPFYWRGVVSTPKDLKIYDVNTLNKRVVLIENMEILKEIEKYTKKSKLLKAFNRWSRFPYYKVSEDKDGVTINYGDLRFVDKPDGFMAQVQLDSQGKVISEEFSFKKQ